MSFIFAELPTHLNTFRASLREQATGSKFGNRDILRSLRRCIASAILSLLLFSGSLARGLEPSTHISQYGHTSWRLGQNGLNGLPVAIAQTKDGYIWVGTAEGLLRFDGVRYTRWIVPAGEQLRSSVILSLLGAKDGSLYIATDLGVARLSQGHIYNYPEPLHYTDPLIEDQQGEIWTGTHGNDTNSSTLCQVGLSHLFCKGMKDGLNCMYGYSLASETPGSIWIGSRQGICRWRQNGPPENFSLPFPLEIGEHVKSIAFDSQGSAWAGITGTAPDVGLLKLSHGLWKIYKTREVDGSKLSISSLLFDQKGTLWIGTDSEGLYRLREGRLDHFSTADGLSGNSVMQIFEGREGCLWVVTNRGVDVFRDLAVLTYTSQEGLSNDLPTAIIGKKNGDVWIGTAAGTLDSLHNQHFSHLRIEARKTVTTYLFTDSHDQLWSGYGKKLLLYHGNQFSAVMDQDNSEIGPIIEMQEDNRHQLWASPDDRTKRNNGLLRIEGMHVVEKAPSPDGQTINALAPNPEGGLWAAGDDHGLFWFHNGKFNQVKPGGFDGFITDLKAEPDGGLWLSTQQGSILYKNGKAQTLSARNGLPCDASSIVVNDHAGSHWFYLECGIARVADTELISWWKDPARTIQSTFFSALDGAQVKSFGERPWLAPDGRQWSINGSAVQMLDPRHIPFNPHPPPVHIEKLLINHIDRPVKDGLRLPVSPRDVEIDYVGLSYVVPDKVRFQYQLIGHDNDWVEAGTRRQAFYNDLKPGKYKFRVIASNNDGVWNTEGATLSFIVPPAWFQTLWFRLLCLIVTLGIAFSIYYVIRFRRYAASMRIRFDERLEERTRLARDLHDTLMQTIQSIKMVADNAQDKMNDPPAKNFAMLISDWSGRATIEGRAALDSLRKSTTEGNDLAKAFHQSFEGCSVGGAINVDLSVIGRSKEMHPIVRDEVYRIGDEAIRNACLHSGGRRLDIELLYDDNLQLRVRDNGKGIDPETLEAGREGHYGITGMRERAARIGARLDVTTSPKGTEVVLSVPGKAIYASPSARIKRLMRRVGRNRRNDR